MRDPRVEVVTGDAREVLTAGRGRYGVIFSEPSNPYRAGVASLFTREFYRAVAARLEPDGVFLQWVQSYEVDAGTIDTLIATLAEVFPAVEVWQSHQIDLLLVASRAPLAHDAAVLRARLREEPFASALRSAWRATALEDVLARFVAGPALARAIREAGVEPNGDDRNPLEFSFARTLSRAGLFDVETLRARAAALGADRPAIEGEVDWGRVERQRLAIYTIAGSAAPPRQAASEADAIRARAHAEYVRGELRAAVATFRGQPAPPEGAVETAIFAEGLADGGDPGASAYIRELQAIDASEAEAAAARLALRVGQPEIALGALVSAFTRYRSDPWPGQIPMSHALALAGELGAAHPEAAPLLRAALDEPFAVAALEEPRRLVRLNLAAADAERCRAALHAFEPHVPWRADFLRLRASCYEKTRDERSALARRELAEFEAAER
jgi:hypothetical protein